MFVKKTEEDFREVMHLLPLIAAKTVAFTSRQEVTLLSKLYLLSITIGNASEEISPNHLHLHSSLERIYEVTRTGLSSPLSSSLPYGAGHPCAGYLGHPFGKSACCARLIKFPCRSM